MRPPLAAAALAIGWALAGMGAERARADLTGEHRQAQCDLEDCWKELFPRVRAVVDDGARAIEAYRSAFKAKMEKAEGLDAPEGEREDALLAYKLSIVKRYLEECESLKDGPRKARHLIIVGHHFYKDGRNFELAAGTQYQEILKQTCGDPAETEAYRECKRGIVVLEDTNKRDLLNYLRLMGKGAAKSLTYVGHGIANALVLGPKDLLLPVDWKPGLKITRDEWRKRNIGMLYSKDLDGELSSQLRRVLGQTAPMTFLACHTGEEFAPKVKAQRPKASVRGAIYGMHFEYLNDAGEWITDWANPVPPTALQTRLVPDVPDMFGEVQPLAPEPPAVSQDVGATSDIPQEGPPERSALDTAAYGITLRLAINAADEAVLSGGKRLIVYSEEERTALQRLLGERLQGNSLTDKAFGYDNLMDLLSEAETAAPDVARKEFYRSLRAKLRDCIHESVQLYY